MFIIQSVTDFGYPSQWPDHFSTDIPDCFSCFLDGEEPVFLLSLIILTHIKNSFPSPRCFLDPQLKKVSDPLTAVKRIILEFGRLISENWDEMSPLHGNQRRKLEKLHTDFRKYAKFLFRVLLVLSENEVTSSTHIKDLFLRLNFNGYYQEYYS